MKELICITCPKGCHLRVDEENGYRVTGNGCERGAVYGANELRNPTRMLTSTVVISGAAYRRLPVKTSHPIPKSKIFDVMQALDRVHVQAPVAAGTILLAGAAGTDADIVATRTMEKI